MATPRVFVSSTCYDLKYIRDNLRYFITTLGYEPILSEDGAVFFDPSSHTHDSCLTEIPNCQLFVLIIGGRYGGKFQGTEDSITNMEYREAIKHKIPVFTLVESGVLHDHHTYLTNKKNKDIDLTKFNFPSSDSIKIFEFIDEVRKASSNNALVPFRDFNDIECYLRKQWAGMIYDFLTKKSASEKITDYLEVISQMNSRIELLSHEILNSVGTKKAKLNAIFYEEMLSNKAIQDLTFLGLKPKPVDILNNPDFTSYCNHFNKELTVDKKEGFSITDNGSISESRLKSNENKYSEIRNLILETLKKENMSLDEYLNDEA
ncbi:DUF4062 domain-containing protein [Acinetobacter tibetensis]|uniref:DUF4062 domain-containing protein n=1 Tax=Acinetobacter tibetensis TaxID=2943497 RepID=A0AAE9S081_9GAMM|nr:DUF4062 domain-containing protein [Acinetobacter tibetensis]USE83421.1 DUF4062 domain-containing protein [Acinetobacter tibetensis]